MTEVAHRRELVHRERARGAPLQPAGTLSSSARPGRGAHAAGSRLGPGPGTGSGTFCGGSQHGVRDGRRNGLGLDQERTMPRARVARVPRAAATRGICPLGRRAGYDVGSGARGSSWGRGEAAIPGRAGSGPSRFRPRRIVVGGSSSGGPSSPAAARRRRFPAPFDRFRPVLTSFPEPPASVSGRAEGGRPAVVRSPSRRGPCAGPSAAPPPSQSHPNPAQPTP